MSLKFSLDDDGFAGLEESVQGMYQKADDGSYRLSVEGMPEIEDVSGLKAQRDALLEEKKKAQLKQKEVEREAAERERKAAEEAGNYESLFKSSEKEREDLKSDLQSLRESIVKEKAEATAMGIAAELADGNNVKILSRFVADRIRVGEDGSVTVLSASGEPTVSTIEDLKKEFTTGGDFDSLLRGNKAAGGGASQQNGSGAAKKFNDYTPQELSEIRQNRPDEYDRLKSTIN